MRSIRFRTAPGNHDKIIEIVDEREKVLGAIVKERKNYNLYLELDEEVEVDVDENYYGVFSGVSPTLEEAKELAQEQF